MTDKSNLPMLANRPRFIRIPTAAVVVPPGPGPEEHVIAAVVDSVQRCGHIVQPIGVSSLDNGKFLLRFGRVRYAVAIRRGDFEIDCVVLTCGAEVDPAFEETACRRQLTVLEFANQMKRHCELLISAGQIVRSGVDGRRVNLAELARRIPVPGSTEDARRKNLERLLKIASLPDDIQCSVIRHGLDNHQQKLLQIFECDPDHRTLFVLELAQRGREGRKASPTQPNDAPDAEAAPGRAARVAKLSRAAVANAADRAELSSLRARWKSSGLEAAWATKPQGLKLRFVEEVLGLDISSN